MPHVAIRKLAAVGLIAVALAACGKPTKEDLLKRSDGAETKAALEKAIGRPDNINKIGPIETWTYKAANGDVTFVIAGDQVTISTATDRAPAP